ncbi:MULTISPECIES: LytTR family DNA-binding domain-containing protein [unclassified Fusibacter]|uniref:LytR/AlgR family response regulator transcription factor n=1 Tax=unclassified Fusibacter TaxID=2624464 RepID=UPI00101229BE|nr:MULTISPECIES: LytTR family DNA-binding domain-containing protein [unclassified Fusibacter]MCK8058221.1 LytTR family DNA-binding domain-containing protein [Fusibacter sp. A2]NPE20804.1 response regulator transcription factor [Fusibacter sp. A1]RXV63008.1 DNA-binding response regulator [Fusibacter sp. A1]
MLNIYICEDDPKQRRQIAQTVHNAISIEELDMQIAIRTGDPHELIENIANKNETGIYFLDVDLQADINGIQLGEIIRKHDPRGFIIYITTHAEMSLLTFTYKVEALDYIVKDERDKISARIKECLININEKYSTAATDVLKSFYVKNKEKTVHMAYEDIVFFETSATAHKVLLHANDRSIEFYSNMNDIKDKLDDRFIRCHRSYIVNLDKLEEVDKTNRVAKFVNGQSCFISTRGMKLLTDAMKA